MTLFSSHHAEGFFSDLQKDTELIHQGGLSNNDTVIFDDEKRALSLDLEKEFNNELSPMQFPEKALYSYLLKLGLGEFRDFVNIIESFQNTFDLSGKSINDAVLALYDSKMITKRALVLNSKFLVHLNKKVPLKVWTPILFEIKKALSLINSSEAYFKENFKDQYKLLSKSNLSPVLIGSNFIHPSSMGKIHQTIMVKVYESLLKSKLQQLKSLLKIIEFSKQKSINFKILYLSSLKSYQLKELATVLTRNNIRLSAFLGTQGGDFNLRKLLYHSFKRKLLDYEAIDSFLKKLSQVLNSYQQVSKELILDQRKWIHPHLKKLINDPSKEILIHQFLRVLPKQNQDRIQVILRKSSQLEIYENSLVVSLDLQTVLLDLSPERANSLRKNSSYFKGFEENFPKSYHLACRLIIIEYFTFINGDLLQEMPTRKYKSLVSKFSAKKQTNISLSKRWFSLSKVALQQMKENQPKLESQSFKPAWFALERDLIWFHNLILSLKVDFKLHRFKFSNPVKKKLQAKLNRSIHLTDLFELMNLQDKELIQKKYKELSFYRLELIEGHLYLLEKGQGDRSIEREESLLLYTDVNQILLKKAKDLILLAKIEKLKALESYYSKKKGLFLRNSKVFLRKIDQSLQIHLRLRETKIGSKSLRNLIYILES
ncbi:hypothetical protein MJH12_13885 [bacterium]|nr:hypothetical protein [bacterium]